MHCILSLLKHVSRKSEGRRARTVDPAPKSSPDHPFERGRGRETGIGREFRAWFRGSQRGVWGLGSSPAQERERGRENKVKFASGDVMVRSGSPWLFGAEVSPSPGCLIPTYTAEGNHYALSFKRGFLRTESAGLTCSLFGENHCVLVHQEG